MSTHSRLSPADEYACVERLAQILDAEGKAPRAQKLADDISVLLYDSPSRFGITRQEAERLEVEMYCLGECGMVIGGSRREDIDVVYEAEIRTFMADIVGRESK